MLCARMILKTIKPFVFSIVLATVACTSTSSWKNTIQEEDTKESTSYDFSWEESELTEEQQAAFDAFNTLQTSTDKMNRLYSTFANTNHPFYPTDTNFTITQSEFLTYMEKFVSKNCQNLSKDIRDELAKTAVAAQEVYTVLFCNTESEHLNVENGLPSSGTWVIPNILGRRDVIMVW